MRIIDNIQGLSSMILILMLDVISGINAFADRMRLALGRTNQRCIIMLVPYSRFPLLVGGTSVDNWIWSFCQRGTYSAGAFR